MSKQEVLDKDRYKYICMKSIGNKSYEVRYDIKTGKRVFVSASRFRE
ncbi:unnamed protein product [marine sediment metagenome]|uniref:Uncharacterized protein n=1 Tax=marine sediment metagenome TaxID=412755 RepID=X0Z6S6_9ZZZZ